MAFVSTTEPKIAAAPTSHGAHPHRKPPSLGRTGECAMTCSGRMVDHAAPKPDDIHPRDIAASLAKLCRFTGHVDKFFSVAQHSILVANALPLEMQPYGLLHDAHEAYIGDIAAPLKRTLARLAGVDAIAMLDSAYGEAIHRRFGLLWPVPGQIRAAIKHFDLVALATEIRDLMPSAGGFGPLPDPLPRAITAQPWHRAEDQFLRALARTFPAINI